jgi:hypothetical protein
VPRPETAEATYFDLVAALQREHNGVEDVFDDGPDGEEDLLQQIEYGVEAC